MQSLTEGNFVLAKLEDGEKVMPTLLDVIEEEEIFSGIILSGIGMLRDFNLNYFDGKKYVERQYMKPLELVALHGSIAVDSSVHLHAALADKDHKMVGGHLSAGVVNNLVELTIFKLENRHIERKLNPKTGLSEFHLVSRPPLYVEPDDDEGDE